MLGNNEIKQERRLAMTGDNPATQKNLHPKSRMKLPLTNAGGYQIFK